MLTQPQKKQLRALIAQDKTKYQIGKSEVTNALLDMLDKALTARELIKIEVLKSATSPVMEITLDLSSKLNADVVQVVGRVIVLYRKNKENPRIKLK